MALYLIEYAESAGRLSRDKTIVAVLPDNGDKYLTTNLFETQEPVLTRTIDG